MKNKIYQNISKYTNFADFLKSKRYKNYVDFVDLVKSFPTSIYFQKSTSIQPRTNHSKTMSIRVYM